MLRVPPQRRGAALIGARDLRGGSAVDQPLWTLARLAREIAARAGETIWSGHLSVVPRKGEPLAPVAPHAQQAVGEIGSG